MTIEELRNIEKILEEKSNPSYKEQNQQAIELMQKEYEKNNGNEEMQEFLEVILFMLEYHSIEYVTKSIKFVSEFQKFQDFKDNRG